MVVQIYNHVHVEFLADIDLA